MSETGQQTPIQADSVGNVEYVMVDSAGVILYYGNVPSFMVSIQEPPPGGQQVIGYGRAETHYVSVGRILPRPANPATLDGVTLKTLPSPCKIMIGTDEYDCTGDTCELSFTQPGTYTVTVSAWPMLDATFEVTQA